MFTFIISASFLQVPHGVGAGGSLLLLLVFVMV